MACDQKGESGKRGGKRAGGTSSMRKKGNKRGTGYCNQCRKGVGKKKKGVKSG